MLIQIAKLREAQTKNYVIPDWIGDGQGRFSRKGDH